MLLSVVLNLGPSDLTKRFELCVINTARLVNSRSCQWLGFKSLVV